MLRYSLAGFSTIPLWTLTALGLTASRKDAEAFLALWRHVGYYMGISPNILRRYWKHVEVADQFLSSMLIHVFAPLKEEDNGLFTGPTMPILLAAANRPPAYSSVEWNCAVTHRLLGHELATYLKVPEPDWRMKATARVMFLIQAIPVLFTKYYGGLLRSGWVKKKRWAYATSVALTLRRGLGNRRTKFRPGGYAGGLDKPQWEDERVTEDEMVSRKVKKAFNEAIAEMVAVLVGCGGLTLFSIWKTCPFLAHYYIRLVAH